MCNAICSMCKISYAIAKGLGNNGVSLLPKVTPHTLFLLAWRYLWMAFKLSNNWKFKQHLRLCRVVFVSFRTCWGRTPSTCHSVPFQRWPCSRRNWSACCFRPSKNWFVFVEIIRTNSGHLSEGFPQLKAQLKCNWDCHGRSQKILIWWWWGGIFVGYHEGREKTKDPQKSP